MQAMRRAEQRTSLSATGWRGVSGWLALELEDQQDRLHISHTMAVGFKGIGRILDPLLRLYFTADFCRELDEHAQIEFPLLAQLLLSRSSTGSSRPY